MIKTLLFTAARAVDKFIAVVVLPTPPFWLAIDIIEGLEILLPLSFKNFFYSDYLTRGITYAIKDIIIKKPVI